MTMLLHDLALYTGFRTVFRSNSSGVSCSGRGSQTFPGCKVSTEHRGDPRCPSDGDHHATVIRIQLVDLGEVNL